MRLPTSLRILIRAGSQFGANNDAQMGAALAYYAVFSTAPLLVLAVLAADLVYRREAATARLTELLTRGLGAEGARAVTSWMEHTAHPAQGTLAAVLGIGFLVLGTLGGFLHVRRCLCVIWRLEPLGGTGFLGTVLNYALAGLAVPVVGVLLLVSLAASTAVGVAISLMGQGLPGGAAVWHWIDAGVSFLLLAVFFAVVSRVLSAWQIPWRYLWYGSFISAFLFTIGKTLIGMYLAYTSTVSVYGAAGSLVVFLVWVYYSAQILFFGAELIQARRTREEWLAAPARAKDTGG
jgi:membrane protein